MRPVNIVILVLAGAIGGAVVMKVAQRPKVQTAAVEAPAAPASVPEAAPAVVQPAPAPAPPLASAPVPEPQPAPEMQPETPAAPVRKAAKPAAVHHAAPKPLPAYSRPSPFEKPKEPPVAVAQAAPPERVEQPAAPPQPPSVPAPPAARPDPEPAAPVPPPQPAPNSVTLNPGILLQVRLVDGLSSDRNQPGDAFIGTLDRELVADGFVIAERGSRVEGQVVSVDRGAKTHGGATLAVELTRLHTSDNQNVAIRTDSFEKRSEPNRTTDVEKVGGGAALGAIIGAIAGGGKGAAVGAGVGGGAGAGDVLLTRKPAALPSETRITFRLAAPVVLTERIGG